MVAAIVIDATYGYQVKNEDDDMVDLFDQVMHDFAEGIMPGAHLVDIIPWRMSQYLILNPELFLTALSVDLLPSWLPGMGFKKQAEEQHNRLLRFVSVPFTFAKESVVSLVVTLANYTLMNICNYSPQIQLASLWLLTC
jgi:hypothetical protein